MANTAIPPFLSGKLAKLVAISGALVALAAYGITGTSGPLVRATGPAITNATMTSAVLTTPTIDGVASSPAMRRYQTVDYLAGVSKELTVLPIEVGFSAATGRQGAWSITKPGTSSVVLNDSDHYGSGTDCALFTTDGQTGTASGGLIITSPTYTNAIDFTDSFPVLAIKVADFTALKDLGQFVLYATSDSGSFSTNNYNWSSLDHNDANPTARYLTPDGQWLLLAFPFSQANTTGSPNRAAIKTLRFKIFDNYSGSGGAVAQAVVRLGMLGISRNTNGPFPNGVVTITMDDGRAGQYSYAFPAMESRNMRGTAYVITEQIGVSSYMTEAQLNNLAAHGWDVAPHAYREAVHTSGFPSVGAAGTIADLSQAIVYHRARGWDIRHFADPRGMFNAETNAAVMGLGAATLSTTYGNDTTLKNIETWPPVARERVTRFTATSLTTTTIKQWVDNVKAYRLWGIIAFHNFITGATSGSDWNKDDFVQFVEYLVQQGVPVRTMSQMMPRRHRKRSSRLTRMKRPSCHCTGERA